MSYNPKIFIRDYGDPTRRLLALPFTGAATFNPASLNRALVVGAAKASLQLTGFVSLLNLAGGFAGFAGVFLLTGVNAGFARALVSTTSLGAFALVGSAQVIMRRNLILATARGLHQISGMASTLYLSINFAAGGASFLVSGVDSGFVRGFALSTSTAGYLLDGDAVTLRRDVRMSATADVFSISGNASFFLQQGRIRVSGDMQSGADTIALSGDAQSGNDNLLISEV